MVRWGIKIRMKKYLLVSKIVLIDAFILGLNFQNLEFIRKFLFEGMNFRGENKGRLVTIAKISAFSFRH